MDGVMGRHGAMASGEGTPGDGLRVLLDYRAWFQAVQLLLRPHEVTAIAVQTADVARRMGLPLAQACASWLEWQLAVGHLSYLFDPAGQDMWWSPRATFARRGGDCEDLAIMACSVLLAAGRPSTMVFGLVRLDDGWLGHAWVEGIDEHGGFLLEATSGRLFRGGRPPNYRASVAISKGSFTRVSPGRLAPTHGRGFGRVAPPERD